MKAQAFLVLRPIHNWQGKVESVAIDRLMKTTPKLNSSEIALKLSIEIEANVFEQFLPEVQIKLDDRRKLITPEAEIEEPEEPEPEPDEEP